MPAPMVIRVHEDEGIRTGLVVSQGPKWLGVIWPDSSGMRIRKIPVDGRFEAIDYNVNKAKRKLRECGRNFGITKSAKLALRA